MGIQEPIPDFVVSGYQNDEDGLIYLFASKELTRARLSEEQPLRENRLLNQWDLDGPLRIDLTATMKNYVIVSAPTYPQAWEELFKIWSAESDNEKAIGTTTLGKYAEITARDSAINLMNRGG